MRRKVIAIIAAATLAGGSAHQAQAQDDEPAETAPDRAAFQQAFEQYKDFVRRIEGLRNEFQTADGARREAINAESRELIESTKLVMDRLVGEALKIYRADPGADQGVEDLLVHAATFKVRGSGPMSQGGDQYEPALEIIRALIDGGAEEKALPMLGVVAAFCTNHYDLVEEYAQLAQENEALTTPTEENDRVGAEIQQLALDYSTPSLLEEYRKLWAREQELRAAEAEANDLPRVELETTQGEIVLELFENEAPNTVANFISLVKDGYYDGLRFHRVLPRFMAQGGDNGEGGPGYYIPCECYQDDARMHFRGSLSMAKLQPRDTGSAQFFLTFVPTYHLNGKHTVFGRVIEGMDVLSEIQRVDPQKPSPWEDKIVKATVLRDRGHDYSFTKVGDE